MGLFSWFKSNPFASMDELEQMDLADGLGIIEIKNDIQSIKAQLNDLEESSNWKDNIITAEEAAGRLKQIENKALPKELNKAFAAIDEALDDEQDSLILIEYTKEFNGYTACGFSRYERVRVYHIDNLAEALRKYGYKVDIYDPEDDYGLRIKIYLRVNNGLEFPKIDPDKKYILPMEGSDRFAKKDLDKWIFIGDGRTAEEAFHSTCLYHDDTFTVQGKDILDGPDWVKAIKPIEVKE